MELCPKHLKGSWPLLFLDPKHLHFSKAGAVSEETFGKLIEKKLSIINAKDCTRNFIKCAPIEVLHNKKVLYDFLEYYISINDELSKIDENTKGKYCKYIIHIFELYHKLYEEDRQWGLLQRYENELKLFRDKFTNEKELSSLKSKCNIDNSLVESFKNVKTTDFLEGNYLRGRAISTRYDNRFTKIKSEYKENKQWGLLHRYEDELSYFTTTFTNENTLSSLKSKCNIDNLLIKSFKNVKTKEMLEGNYLRGRVISTRYDNNFTKIKSEYENVIKELASSNIYNELSKDASGSEYEKKHCDKLKVVKNEMKDICKKMAKNIKTLRSNSEMSDLSHRDRCTYLNFWMYREISKLYTSEDKKLTDITDVANLIDANIKINKDLIKDDFDVNYKAIVRETAPSSSTPTSGAGNSQESSGAEESLKNGKTTPPNSNKGGEGSDQNKNVAGSARNAGTEGSQNNKELKKPAKFVKHYELSRHEPCYFNYDCTFSECREMKHLYEYFKAYDKIKGNIKCEHRKKDKYYTYLKYMSYLYNKHKYEEECCSWGATVCSDYFLECDEYYDPNKLVSAIESHDHKEFLISDPNTIITGEANSNAPELKNYNTPFPEIRGVARKNYIKQAEEACKNGTPKEGMEIYCKRSKRCNDIINGVNLQSRKLIEVSDTQNWENIDSPADT
ncbi:PIR protein [Plasmodium vivax]|uniref:VIR protein n=2 Tax=Plasmodium vivax TaxID=5855 RepID=A0A564ZXH3_PLAVI|nr:PIR protein [Plasmodium vivax]